MQHAVQAQNLVDVHYLTMTEVTATKHHIPLMHQAVELNNWQLVLILSRFEAQKRDSVGETCLHKAARLGYAKIVEILALRSKHSLQGFDYFWQTSLCS